MPNSLFTLDQWMTDKGVKVVLTYKSSYGGYEGIFDDLNPQAHTDVVVFNDNGECISHPEIGKLKTRRNGAFSW